MMLFIIEIIVANINSWLISICLSLLIFCAIFFLNIWIHEFGHWIVTKFYCGNISCKIIIPCIIKKEKPHTESEFYADLEKDNQNPSTQKIIRNISIAGYIANGIFLVLLLTIFFILGCVFKLKLAWINSFLVFILIIYDLYKYIFRSKDRKIYKNPGTFKYDY